ncbi:MAG: hypothetical protein P1U63_04150 [Coxiellaceae bacterium]|nr:hypothetical protein [Coxiellaceae bacterium]
MPKTKVKTPPPRTIKLAIQLMCLTVIDQLLIVLFAYTVYKVLGTSPETYYTYSTPKMMTDVGLYLVVICTAIFLVSQRNQWGRIFFSIYILGHALINYSKHTLLASSLAADIFLLCYFLLVTISITLLFSPDSNAWFKGKKTQPVDNIPVRKKPKTVVLAVQLQLLNIVFFLAAAVLAYFYYRQINQPIWLFSTNSTIELLIDTPIHLILMTTLLIAISRQKKWGRTIFLIYAIYRILFHFYTHNLMGYTTTIETLVNVFLLLNAISLTLLYCPSSNSWFKFVNKKTKKHPGTNDA